MKLSVKQYADIKGVTPQAITKKIRKNAKDGQPLHTNIEETKAVEKVGNSYIITTK